jgi:hypothetical protein
MGATLSTNQPALSGDNQLKIYRQLFNENSQLAKNGIEEAERYKRLTQRHNELEKLYSTKDFTCPKVRFGRTGLQMPILTCGGMR